MREIKQREHEINERIEKDYGYFMKWLKEIGYYNDKLQFYGDLKYKLNNLDRQDGEAIGDM